MNTILAAVAPHLVEGALTLFLLAGSWLAAQGARFFGAGREQKAREALLGLVETVAEQARERLRQELQGRLLPSTPPSARAGILAEAALPIIAGSAEYVAEQMPGKMGALGVDKAAVERMLSLRMGFPPSTLSGAVPVLQGLGTYAERLAQRVATDAPARHD